jgi:hypothetical protein
MVTYDTKEWAARTRLGRHVFNYRFQMLGDELKGWELLKTVLMHESRAVEEKVYVWQSKGDPGRDLVRIAIAELADWRAAQKRLLEELKNCMRADIPTGTGKLASLGDVSFVGRDPLSDIPVAASFARGNVCASVRSVGDRSVDVSEIAARLDHALGEPPTRSELDKGRVRVRAPRTATIEARRAFTLIENLTEAAPRGGWLKIIAPDGELSKKGDALMYVSPEGGKKDIGTYAVPAA